MNNAQKLFLLSQITYEKLYYIFCEENIEIIVLKGPHLAYTVYDNPFERSWADLDILIKPEYFNIAKKLLIKNGFKEKEFVKGRKYTKNHYYVHAFISPLGITLELHRNLSNLNRFPVNIDNLFGNKKEFNFGNVKAYGLGKEDLLLSLCIHILKSYFDVEEKHILDIYLLLKKKEINWDVFLKNANYSKIKNGSYFIFKIVEKKYNCTLPEYVMEKLKPNKLELYFLNKILDVNNYPYNKFKDKNSLLNLFLLNLLLIDNKFLLLFLSFKYAYIRILDFFYK